MGLTHLGKIRTKLLSNTIIQSFGCSITPAHISDIQNPVYPIITMFDNDGTHSTWDRQTFDPGNVMFQIAVQSNLEDCHRIYDAMIDTLHLRRKELTVAGVILFHDIRETWHNSGLWDRTIEAWVLSSRFLIRATVLQTEV